MSAFFNEGICVHDWVQLCIPHLRLCQEEMSKSLHFLIKNEEQTIGEFKGDFTVNFLHLIDLTDMLIHLISYKKQS